MKKKCLKCGFVGHPRIVYVGGERHEACFRCKAHSLIDSVEAIKNIFPEKAPFNNVGCGCDDWCPDED